MIESTTSGIGIFCVYLILTLGILVPIAIGVFWELINPEIKMLLVVIVIVGICMVNTLILRPFTYTQKTNIKDLIVVKTERFVKIYNNEKEIYCTTDYWTVNHLESFTHLKHIWNTNGYNCLPGYDQYTLITEPSKK